MTHRLNTCGAGKISTSSVPSAIDDCCSDILRKYTTSRERCSRARYRQHHRESWPPANTASTMNRTDQAKVYICKNIHIYVYIYFQLYHVLHCLSAQHAAPCNKRNYRYMDRTSRKLACVSRGGLTTQRYPTPWYGCFRCK